jgi:glycosyltransferase involved in cell wall biosynthesis
MNKKNILLINEKGFIGGGTENRVKGLVKKILKSNLFNSIVLISINDRFCYKNIFFKHIGNFSFFRVNYFSVFFEIIKIIKKYKIDIVQIHNVNFYVILALIYVYFKRIPVVFFLHDFWPLCAYKVFMHPCEKECISFICNDSCVKCVGLKQSLKTKFMKFILNFVDIGIAPGEKIKEICKKSGLLKNKWKIIIPWISKNKIQEKEFEIKNTRDKKKIYFVGALTPYKGAWVLAKASNYLKNEKLEYHYVGSFQEGQNSFKEDIKKYHNKTDEIYFHGELSGQAFLAEFNKADILVFSSVWPETFGQVWAEAMALGISVVASDIGGITEYVKGLGTLFKPGNSYDLACKLRKVLNERNFNQVRSAQKFVAKKCNIDTAFNKLEKIYSKLLLR